MVAPSGVRPAAHADRRVAVLRAVSSSALHAVVRTLRQVLSSEIQDNYLAADNVQVAAKQCLRGLFAFQAMLVDLGGEIHHHPYDLFASLRALYLEVCVFRDVQPTAIERPYAHEDLAGSFDSLLAGIEEQVQINKQKIPYTEFVRRGGMLVSTLAKDMKRAKEVFLLVQKPQVSTTLDLSRVKLASESRIHTVYERALRGDPVPPARRELPFHHGLSATVDFYAIAPGQEWDPTRCAKGKSSSSDAPQLQGTRGCICTGASNNESGRASAETPVSLGARVRPCMISGSAESAARSSPAASRARRDRFV